MKYFFFIRNSLLVVLVGIFTAASAYGGSSYGTVALVDTNPSGGPSAAGVVFIYMSNPNTAPPSCDTYNTSRFVADLGTPGGQATYSSAMAARVSGQPIAITGTGDCGVWGDTETVSQLQY